MKRGVNDTDRGLLPALSRRRFIGLGLGGAMLTLGRRALAAGRPDWMRRPGAPFSLYGHPAEAEKGVVRWGSANRDVPGNGVSWCPLHQMEGIVTPNGLHFERHHNGVPAIDPAGHQLQVDGRVQRSLSFAVADLQRYPLVSRMCFIECGGNSNAGWHSRPSQSPVGLIHGLLSCAEWTGVPLAVVLDECGVNEDGSWLIAEGADAFAMHVSLPLQQARAEGMLALFQNGERLRPENGYPLRLVLPGWEGVHHVKWLRRLHVSRHPVMARNETSKYTELQTDGRARQFSRRMGVKSVITSPSPGMVAAPGRLQISGLAWSGAGRIRSVQISTDGGRLWQNARLQEPVLPYCLTRFRYDLNWKGQRMTLQSRAVDDSGAIQPSRRELVQKHGRFGYYHYNGVVVWQLNESGAVSHIYDTAGASDHSDAPGLDADWF